MNEAERIVREYARREVEIPGDLYSPTSPAELFMTHSKERAAVALLGEAGALPIGDRRILEVGCGTAPWLAKLESWGARRHRLAGLDLLPRPVERARERLGPVRSESGAILSPGADLRIGDASRMEWENESFDVVIQSTVFSSILDASMRSAVAAEMARVLAPGGLVLWFDFFVDNPGNRNVRGVGRDELAALFPGFFASVRRIVLAPPVSRRLVPRTWLGAQILEGLRLFNTHIMAVLRR